MIALNGIEKIFVSIPQTASATNRVSFYDENENFIEGNSNNGVITIPNNASFFRATGHVDDNNEVFFISLYDNLLLERVDDIERTKENKETILFHTAILNSQDVLSFATIPLESFELYQDGCYINNNGDIVPIESYKVVRHKIDYDIRLINVKYPISGNIPTYIGVVELKTGAYIALDGYKYDFGTNNRFGTPINGEPKYIYLNIDKTGNATSPEYVQFLLSQPQKFLLDSILCPVSTRNCVAINKYVTGAGQLEDLANCAVYKIYLDTQNYNYRIDNNPGVIGAYFDGTGNYVGGITSSNTNINHIPFGAKYALVNYQYNTNVYAIPKTIKNKNYCSVIGEKIDFNNKSIVFFGDSIMAGVGASEVSKRWVNIFSQKLIDNNGLSSFRNLGSSGATFVSGQVGRAQIEALIQSATISEDIIIIAAGTNDYGVNIPIGKSDDLVDTTFYGALNSLTDYLSQNYPSKKIIFVLPVGRFLAEGDNDMDSYREVIFASAIKNGFMVIDGSDFGLPCNTDVMPDGLHPNDIGHRLYANKMYDILVNP